MKKLARKLVLSAMAMGLAVVTLSTTTYAWYVSNTEATVNGLNGMTATVSDPNLLVSKDSSNQPTGGFSSSIESLTPSVNSELTPVTRDVAEGNSLAKEFKDQEGKTVYTIGGSNSNSAPYIEYKFWVYTTNASKVYVTGTVANSTISEQFGKIKQTAYYYGVDILPDTTNGGETTAPSKVGDQFVADAVRALNCEITSQAANGKSLSEVELSGTANPVGNGALLGLHDGVYSSPNETVTGGDANKYFTKILGYAPYGTEKYGQDLSADLEGTAGTSKEMKNIDLSAGISISDGIPTQITIRIWLEGTSANCWNSCVGQNFSLNLTLKTTAPQE